MLIKQAIETLRKCWTLDQAEVILERQLQQNKSYPFQELLARDYTPVFVYSRRIPYLYYGLVGVASSCLSFLIYGLIGGDQEYYVYASCVLCVSVYLILKFRKKWIAVLHPTRGLYRLYYGHQLFVTGLYHNIYIRMVRKQTGLAQSKCYLMVDGWGFPTPVAFSRLTNNTRRLRQLGLRLAFTLGLNYFDEDDYSNRHYIRNSRPKVMKMITGKDDTMEEELEDAKEKCLSGTTTLSSLASKIRINLSHYSAFNLSQHSAFSLSQHSASQFSMASCPMEPQALRQDQAV